MRKSLNETTNVMRLFRSAAALAAMFLVLAMGNARADLTSLTHTIEIGKTGDAAHKMVLNMDAESYTKFKNNTTNASTFIYRAGLAMGYEDFEKFVSRWDDAASSYTIEFTEYGFTRPIKGDRWAASKGNRNLVEGTLEANRTGTTIALSGMLPGGIMTLIRVTTPPGSSDLDFNMDTHQLSYTLPVIDGTGNDAVGEMEFQAKDEIMSCAAKAYANPKFSQLWVARNIFKNTGSRILKGYRTRWRLAEYSDWSGWEHSHIVAPGQTVCDAFYPIIDLGKVAALTGPVTASLETEYEYRRPDGELVKEADSKRITILARNQLVFTSIPQNKIVGFYDNYANGPLGLSSFVTHNDPVVQQLAGWICGRGGGTAPSSNNKDAVKFMAALYGWISENRIGYQTPPGGISGGKHYQHVKYARDVLHNRAGTCIDLAILYASVTKAVGLRPVMFILPGHCFPAILLPEDNQLLPIETTGMTANVDYETAVKKAFEEVRAARNDGRVYEINVTNFQNEGVDALELVPVPVDYLEKLGYTQFSRGGGHEAPGTGGGGQQQQQGGNYVGLSACVDIRNGTNITVNFRYRTLATNPWNNVTVEPGKGTTIFMPPSTDGQMQPPMYIEFNGDVNGGNRPMSGTITWKMVRDPKKEDGAQYYFAIRDGVLGLFNGVPPRQGQEAQGGLRRQAIALLMIRLPVPGCQRYISITSCKCRSNMSS